MIFLNDAGTYILYTIFLVLWFSGELVCYAAYVAQLRDGNYHK